MVHQLAQEPQCVCVHVWHVSENCLCNPKFCCNLTQNGPNWVKWNTQDKMRVQNQFIEPKTDNRFFILQNSSGHLAHHVQNHRRPNSTAVCNRFARWFKRSKHFLVHEPTNTPI